MKKPIAVIVNETAMRVCKLLGRNWEARNDVLAAIQEGIDAATAEVKKEESLGSETHATLDVQREEPGELVGVEWVGWTTDRIVKELNDHGCFRLIGGRKELESIRALIGGFLAGDLDKLKDYEPSEPGSEVPTQKAPTDTAVQKETASVSPAAPPRKQEVKREHLVESAAYWFDAAREAQDKGQMAEALMCMENAYNHVENALAAKEASCLAARVEPTKDTERLEFWINRRSWTLQFVNLHPEPFWEMVDQDGRSVSKGKTPREAIDAASCAVKEEK